MSITLIVGNKVRRIKTSFEDSGTGNLKTVKKLNDYIISNKAEKEIYNSIKEMFIFEETMKCEDDPSRCNGYKNEKAYLKAISSGVVVYGYDKKLKKSFTFNPPEGLFGKLLYTVNDSVKQHIVNASNDKLDTLYKKDPLVKKVKVKKQPKPQSVKEVSQPKITIKSSNPIDSFIKDHPYISTIAAVSFANSKKGQENPLAAAAAIGYVITK